MVRNLFIDFTTMAPFTNELPVWSSIAPPEGTIIPLGVISGEELASTETGTWVIDESGWNLQCNFSAIDQYEGWSVRMDEDASLFVTAGGESASAQCAGVDAYGAETSEHRNYTFGRVLTATGTLSAQGDTITFSPSSTNLVSTLTVTAHAHQDANMGPSVTEVVSTQESVMELSLTGISPGEVMVMGTATAQGMLDYIFMMDFDLEKENMPLMILIEMNL
jgi:hypothetical protein